MFANSNATAGIFLDRGVPPERMKVAWNPVGLEAFDNPGDGIAFRKEIGVEDRDLLVGIAGRISRSKKIEHFLEAAGMLAQRFSNARFLIIGGTNTREDEIYIEELKKKVDLLDLRERVIFTGRRTDIPAVMHSLDILAHARLDEGFGRVLAEAMAAGVPVVAPAAGGIPDVVDDERTGFLYPPGDVKAMAEAITVLLEDPEKAKKMGEAGREKVDRLWRAERVADSIAQVYLKLAETKLKR